VTGDTAHPSPPSAGPDRAADRLLLTILLAGLGIRLARFLHNPSLWGDEAALALNVIGRGPAELFGALDLRQSAPPLFLLLVKGATSLLGTGEAALRLIPFLASTAALLLALLFARRHLDRVSGTIFLLFLAAADPLVFQAVQVKQYSLDVLVSVLALLLLGRACSGPVTPTGVILGSLAGGVAALLSDAVPFLLPALSLALLAGPRRPGSLRAGAGALGAGALAFGLHYLLLRRRALGDPYLRDYWAGDFLPFPPRSAEDLLWAPRRLLALFDDPLGFTIPAAAAAAALLGLAVLLARRRPLAVFALAAVGAALCASALGLYPFSASFTVPPGDPAYPNPGRLLLFLAPPGYLLTAAGLGLLVGDRRRPLILAGVVCTALVGGGMLTRTGERLFSPPRIQELRPVVRRMATEAAPGDLFLVHLQGRAVFDYYWLREGTFPPVVRGVRYAGGGREEVVRLVTGTPPGGRIWLVFLFHPRWRSNLEYPALEALLSSAALQEASIRNHNAAASLFRVAGGPGYPPPPSSSSNRRTSPWDGSSSRERR
jgi:hypothetical protein